MEGLLWYNDYRLRTYLNTVIGKPACTYKVHKLLHLAQSIRNCGPLRYTWVFPFERGNLLAARSIHRLDRMSVVLLPLTLTTEPIEEIARHAGLRSGLTVARLNGPLEEILTPQLRSVCSLVL